MPVVPNLVFWTLMPDNQEPVIADCGGYGEVVSLCRSCLALGDKHYNDEIAALKIALRLAEAKAERYQTALREARSDLLRKNSSLSLSVKTAALRITDALTKQEQQAQS